MAMTLQARLTIRGRVQGVGYRQWALATASMADVGAVDIEPVDLDVLPEGFRQLSTV